MDERTFDVYIIGPLSRQNEMQKAALYYLRHEHSVKMLTVNTSICECFENIDRCRQGIVVVTTEAGFYEEATTYFIAYAEMQKKGIVTWKGEPESEQTEENKSLSCSAVSEQES